MNELQDKHLIDLEAEIDCLLQELIHLRACKQELEKKLSAEQEKQRNTVEKIQQLIVKLREKLA